MAMKKRRKVTRQEWTPNPVFRVLQGIWSAAWSVLKIALGAGATVAFIVVICGFVLAGAMGDYLQNEIVPNVNFELDKYDLEQTSYIYYVDNNGDIQRLQKIYTDTDRQWASYEEIPEDLVHAAVAIEDKRFYEHQGVDWITTVKACGNMFFGGSSTFGGSTITQQLVKNQSGDNAITVQRKVEEIFRAQKLETKYDKKTIMEWYLNLIYMGEGCYGVKSAARVYFGKALEDLTTAECASLISITNNPSLFDPYISEERNRKRQLIVLDEMKDQGWITPEEHQQAVDQKMFFTSADEDVVNTIYSCPNGDFEGKALEFNRDGDTFLCPKCGTKVNIELDASADMYSWFVEVVMDDVAEALAEKMGLEWNETNKQLCMSMIKKGGYHIYSTIDVDVQAAVDRIYTNLDEIPTTDSEQQLQSAIVITDNKSGDIVAIAGAVGKKEVYDAFNFATDQGLQTGSAMKPLTAYAPGFEAGVISPASVLPDLPIDYSNGAYPLNESRTYSISTSVLEGVIESINTIAVDVVDMIGTQYSFDFGKDKFRLHGLLDHEVTESGMELSDIGYSPLALGGLTYGVTIRDMANAYSTFPNDGVWREARTFTKVYDSEGNLVLDNEQESEQILSYKANNYVNYVLRNCVSNGYAGYADLYDTAAGGKTGTTTDDKDRWFCGYTRYYTAAVWCGYKYPETIYLTGNYTNPSGRLWAKVMEPIHEGLEYKNLYDSSQMQWVTICLDSGGYATDACSADPRGNRVESVLVYPEDAPDFTCSKHTLVDYCASGNGVANDYCKKVPGLSFSKVGLVKYTQGEIDNIQAAYSVPSFSDDLIYLVDGSGSPLPFHGLSGGINNGINAPYKVCTKHNADSIKPTETKPAETKPTAPTTPSETKPQA